MKLTNGKAMLSIANSFVSASQEFMPEHITAYEVDVEDAIRTIASNHNVSPEDDFLAGALFYIACRLIQESTKRILF